MSGALVHLVRSANGLPPFERFLAALRRHPPGAGYDLVLAFKGFDSEGDAAPYLDRAADLSPTPMFFSDDGLDLTVYLAVSGRGGWDRYCFVNSFSEPLVDGWLAMLDRALSAADVGIAGATGSWASTRSLKAHTLHLPSAYRGVLPPPREAIAQFHALEGEISGRAPAQNGPARWRARLDTIYEIPERTLPYDRFPAYHVRTNAFVIERATLASLELGAVSDKMDAYRLENGRDSITRQLQRRGLRTLVVDRSGEQFDHERWHLSRTLWQGRQEGLLVEDNQTRRYAEADIERRRLLSGYAWGRAADPLPGDRPV